MTIADPRAILLCFSHLRWGFVWQRPHHLLSRAARDYRVIVFEEAYYGSEIETPYLYRAPAQDGVEVVVPHLPGSDDEVESAEDVTRLLNEYLRELGAAPSVLWYYTPAAIAFSKHLDAELIVYDCMDQLAAFKDASPRMAQWENDLFQRADLVTCGGRSLFEDKSRHHKNSHLFPSSIDAPHFRRARSLAAARGKNKRPVLGFFGVIDERLDIDLIGKIARMRPEWTLEMIGPIIKIDPASLPRLPNVVWSGHVDYKDLPQSLARWDIGLMPFAINEATRFISPTKTPEFLAAGLPVISTPVRDVVSPYGDAGLVEIATDARGFVEAAERLLRTPRGEWLVTADEFLSTMSWDRTYAGIRKLMQPRAQQAEKRRGAMVRA
jgi:glycosyltransferase involved in cell wall biosynthesis